jgi:hypothetical protein
MPKQRKDIWSSTVHRLRRAYKAFLFAGFQGDANAVSATNRCQHAMGQLFAKVIRNMGEGASMEACQGLLDQLLACIREQTEWELVATSAPSGRAGPPQGGLAFALRKETEAGDDLKRCVEKLLRFRHASRTAYARRARRE